MDLACDHSSYPQQYSQNVILNFKGLSWPHMSVATVAPLEVKLELINGNFTSHDEKLWQDTIATAAASAAEAAKAKVG